MVKVGDKVYPSKSNKQTIMTIVAIERVLYNGRKVTFVDGVTDDGDEIRRPLSSVILIQED